MLGYSLRRAIAAVPTLFILLTLAFFLMRLTPGGPFDSERQLPPAISTDATYGISPMAIWVPPFSIKT
jgi:oligopeptide transport system permease protein